MYYEIVKMSFSGSEAVVYSILEKGERLTLFEKFIINNKGKYKEEIIDIVNRLQVIGNNTGAREQFFKHEGDNAFVNKYGKYIWALYDEEDKNIRLFCIRFGTTAIILGGGAYKDKSITKWQEDPILSKEVRRVMNYAKHILNRLDKKDLYWSKDNTELGGNLNNYNHE